MRRRTLATLAVVAVLLVAGCTSGGQTTTTTPPDGTDAGTPGQDPTQTTTGPTVESVSPPGIDDGTVTNATAIVAAHERALRNESFTTRYDQVVTGLRTNWTDDAVIRYNGSGGFDQTVESNTSYQGNYTRERWTSGFGATGYGKTTLESGRIGYYATTSTTYESTISAGMLGRLVDAYELEVTDAGTVDGEPVVVVEATGVSNVTQLQQEWLLDTSPQNTSFRMAVDENGVVRSYSHSVATNDTSITINQTVSSIGTTTVEKPRWIETARRQSREFRFDANETTGRISLNFTTGEDIPEGTTMRFEKNNTGNPTEFTLNTTLQSGNVYYVAFEDGQPSLTTEKPPARELNGTFYYLAAVDDDGDFIFQVYENTTAA